MDAQGLRLITALKLCILATKKDGTPLYSDREQYIFSELYGLEGNEIQNMISLGDKLGENAVFTHNGDNIRCDTDGAEVQ